MGSSHLPDLSPGSSPFLPDRSEMGWGDGMLWCSSRGEINCTRQEQEGENQRQGCSLCIHSCGNTGHGLLNGHLQSCLSGVPLCSTVRGYKAGMFCKFLAPQTHLQRRRGYRSHHGDGKPRQRDPSSSQSQVGAELQMTLWASCPLQPSPIFDWSRVSAGKEVCEDPGRQRLVLARPVSGPSPGVARRMLREASLGKGGESRPERPAWDQLRHRCRLPTTGLAIAGTGLTPAVASKDRAELISLQP